MFHLYLWLLCLAALAVALGHLYRDDVVVEADEAAGVLAAAHFLGFHPLAQGYILQLNSNTLRFNIF